MTTKKKSDKNEEVKEVKDVNEASAKQPEIVENPMPEISGGKQVVNAAEYWEFAHEDGSPKHAKFLGHYVSPVLKTEGDEAGKIIGYLFKQYGTEKEYILSSSHAIEKTIEDEDCNEGTLCYFEYHGKGKSDKGTYNKFRCIINPTIN